MKNRDYYYMLPRHIQEQFLENLKQKGQHSVESYLNRDNPDDPYQFIDYAFHWDETPEGDDYWADIAEMIRDGYVSDADFEAFYERHPEHSKRDEIINNYSIY